jgi:hypothetical protein
VTIEFRCSNCQRLLRTPDDTAGRQAQCPECGALTNVPMPGQQQPESPAGEGAPSPFGPPPAGDQPENPYQSPAQHGEIPQYADSNLRLFAAERVLGPSTALIVVGALNIAVQLFSVVVNLGAVGGAGNFGPQPLPAQFPQGALVGILVGTTFVSIALSAFIIWGAVRMRNLQSYGMAMGAAILAMLPCIWPCCLLGLPFGIWALVVLSDADVKMAFRS